MVLEPDVLLLDEPLGALDLKLRERMKIELKLLQHQFDTTFLYITHDQSEALVMSDRVAVMNAGRFEQVGHAAGTLSRAGHAPSSPASSATPTAGAGGSWRRTRRARGWRSATGRRSAAGWGAGPLAEGAAAEVFVRPEAIRLERRRRCRGVVEGAALQRRQQPGAGAGGGRADRGRRSRAGHGAADGGRGGGARLGRRARRAPSRWGPDDGDGTPASCRSSC